MSGHRLKLSYNIVFLSLAVGFVLAISSDPDEMSSNAEISSASSLFARVQV